MIYSASNSGVTLKCGLWVVQGQGKWCRSVCHGKYSYVLYDFQVISTDLTLNNIVTLESSEEGTGRGRSPSRPLLTVPNVTAHLSSASVPMTVLLFNGPLRSAVLMCPLSK